MSKQLTQVLQDIDQASLNLAKAIKEQQATKELHSLADIANFVNEFCKDSKVTKADICLLADISSTTLTNALKHPQKTSMSTILAIGEVVGFKVLLGRGNV